MKSNFINDSNIRAMRLFKYLTSNPSQEERKLAVQALFRVNDQIRRTKRLLRNELESRASLIRILQK